MSAAVFGESEALTFSLRRLRLRADAPSVCLLLGACGAWKSAASQLGGEQRANEDDLGFRCVWGWWAMTRVVRAALVVGHVW